MKTNISWNKDFHNNCRKKLPTMDPPKNIQDTSYKMVNSKYILS